MPESKRDAIMRHIDEMAGVSLDHEKATAAVGSAIEALKKQAEALSSAKYKEHQITHICTHCKTPQKVKVGVNPDTLARTMAYTGKVIDEIGRFVEFAKGNPDSRPQVEMTSILQSLTDEQVGQVMVWVSENEKAVNEPRTIN